MDLNDILFIASGLIFTLKVTFGAIFIAIIFGTIISILRYAKIVPFLANSFVSVIRGTPIILQLAIVYFAVPQLLGIELSVIASSIITFGINSSAYTAEILRGGIESIPKGQFEASKALHIPTFFMWRDIILPQVLRNVLPMIVHEIISLIKETAVVTTIGGLDVMRKAQMVAAEKFDYFTPLFIAGISYYLIILLAEYIGRIIEKKIKNVRNT